MGQKMLKDKPKGGPDYYPKYFLLINGPKRCKYLARAFYQTNNADLIRRFIVKGDATGRYAEVYTTESSDELKIWLDCAGLKIGKQLYSLGDKPGKFGSHREYELVEKENS